MVGLDGLEPTIADPLLAAGELPNLARLHAQGGSSRVATTSPAQTPVAWSTFATGVNPGGHGIFDFLRRDPATYRPDISLTRHEPATAFRPPRAVNLRRGATLWGELSNRGLASTVIRCPGTYPAEPIRGRMLSGMGVPDLRGGFGTATVYSMRPEARALEGERLVRLAPTADPTVRTAIIGPRNPKDRADAECPIVVTRDPAGRKVAIRLDTSSEAVEVFEGRWSDWLLVAFKVGPLRTMRGVVRFYLAGVSPDLELYASPVNYDPTAPPFPISAPADYSRELAEAIGLFHTTGMVEDHGGLNNHRFDEEAFLDQCETAWQEREAMMIEGLKGFDSGLFYCLFDTPDRVQHMFWRFRDPGHASLGGKAPDPRWSQVIEDQYRRGRRDGRPGARARRRRHAGHRPERPRLRPLSARSPPQRLAPRARALLTLRPGLEPGASAGDLLTGIDWSKTRAYAVGLGGIYLNLRGARARRDRRRRRGPHAQGEDRRRADRPGRPGLGHRGDPPESRPARRSIRVRTSTEAPDLTVHFASGYRASSSTSMGGVGAHVIEDNKSKWSGDHIVDPDLVPGRPLHEPPVPGRRGAAPRPGPNDLDRPRACPPGGDGREFADLMKILVIGLDGADPALLLGDERLTNIRGLMEAGCYGRLESIVPPITVPAWICMATSRDPGSIGVYGFRDRADRSYDKMAMVESRTVGDLTVWDQIAREGKRTILVGVPPGFPARKLNGVTVGCFLTPDPAKNIYTHPPAIAAHDQGPRRCLPGRRPRLPRPRQGANPRRHPCDESQAVHRLPPLPRRAGVGLRPDRRHRARPAPARLLERPRPGAPSP